MTFKFDFTPSNTRECVLETEERLRDLIDAVLRRKHGPSWEYDPDRWYDKIKRHR